MITLMPKQQAFSSLLSITYDPHLLTNRGTSKVSKYLA